jgi:hypothetical protein
MLPQKAVLYEKDQANPSGKRFVGFAAWRADRVPPGPAEEAIRWFASQPTRATSRLPLSTEPPA